MPAKVGQYVKLIVQGPAHKVPREVKVGTEGKIIAIRKLGSPGLLVKFKGSAFPRHTDPEDVEVLSCVPYTRERRPHLPPPGLY
jgi:hypothetical protein